MKKSIDTSNEAEMSHKRDEENSIGTILGVDFGVAKIGLAIADEETKIAFAFDTLKNDKEFLPQLKEIVACEHVKTIVLGMTVHEKDTQSAQEKEKFAHEVAQALGIPVVFQEEMFTTKMAQANMRERGRKMVAQWDDQEAARIILQSWLDKNAV